MKLTAGGIHCGIGNLLGLQQADFKIKYLIDDRDFQRKNTQTWLNNFPGIALLFHNLDQVFLPSEEKIDVITSSPSCAQLSLLGVKRKDRDQLKDLGVHDFDFIKILLLLFEKDPEFIVIEYIPRLLTYFKIQNNGILHPFSGELLLFPDEYKVYYEVLNSISFGVPQNRKRLFLIFSKKKYNFVYEPSLIEEFEENFTSGTIFNKLNELRKQKPLLNDEISKHSDERIQGFKNLKYDESYYGTQNNKKLNPDKVCPVITSSKTRHVHPFEPRTLTVRECATFQGFPLDFEFFGKETASLDLIGKTVPPQILKEIGEQIIKSIKEFRNE